MRQALNLVPMAWQASLQNAVSPPRQVASLMWVDPGHDGWIPYDPSGSVAQPGQAGRQRLAQSPRKD